MQKVAIEYEHRNSDDSSDIVRIEAYFKSEEKKVEKESGSRDHEAENNKTNDVDSTDRDFDKDL